MHQGRLSPKPFTMKNIFFLFAVCLATLSACKKDSNVDAAKKILEGTWNQVDFNTKQPISGKFLKFYSSGSMEGTAITGFDKYEINAGQLNFIRSSDKYTQSNTFSISTDSLYIEPNIFCPTESCATLYARQK